VRGLLERARHGQAALRPAEAAHVPVPVAPGSLGSWSPDEDAGAGAGDGGGHR
jgi:hypothetical protein